MKNAKVTTKTYMEHHPDENLYWCKPISFLDGKVIIADADAGICGIRIDGEDIMPDVHDVYSTGYSDAIMERVARLVNESYDLYSGWDNEHIIMEADHEEHGCAACPWFSVCDAMSEECQIYGDAVDEYSEDEIIEAWDDHAEDDLIDPYHA